MSDPQVWVVRGGNNNEIAQDVEKASAIAIGWSGMGKLDSLTSRNEFKKHYRSKYPDASERRVAIGAGQVYRFVRKIRMGDLTLTPIVASREVLVGEVIGDYEFNPQIISKGYPHIRRVKWLGKVSRDDVSPAFKNTLGGISTVFQATVHLDETKALLSGEPPLEPPDGDEPPFYEDVRKKADEMILDLISQIDAYDFQELVAGVLRAMGFRTRVSSKGPDGGVDIRAHPDAFGFQHPRIRIQVKHRKGQASRQEIQQFAGAVGYGGQNHNGLFVSTGGFTKPAESEAEKHPNITMIDRDSFVELLLEHYDNLEPQYQAMIPLRKVYIPVPPLSYSGSSLAK